MKAPLVPVLSVTDLRLTADHPPVSLMLPTRDTASTTLCLLGDDPAILSALLDALAGHRPVADGMINVDGTDISRHLPENRPVCLVSARDPLFAHLSVGENIAFAARARGDAKGAVEAACRKASALMGLDGLEAMRVDRLDTLGRLRVALARAVVRAPRILLLDDPFAGLSPSLQRQAQGLVTMLGQALSQHLVLATTDRETALRCGAPIALFSGAHLLQCAPASGLFDRPADDRVATLFGDANAMPGRVLSIDDDVARVRLPSGGVAEAMASDGLESDSLCILCVRPDRISPVFGATAFALDEDDAPITAVLQDSMHLGDHVRLRFRLADGVDIEVRRAPLQLHAGLKPGAPAQLAWAAGHATAFPMRPDMY
jgi:putative spermidine/putrescine transport system ATP-binding protein